MVKALPTDFADRINMFIHKLQSKLDTELGGHPKPKVRVDPRGRTKLRVFLDWKDTTRRIGIRGEALDDQCREVYCFIRVHDGALLKATSWTNMVYAEPLCSRLWEGDYGLRTCTASGVNYFPNGHPSDASR
jgi:hypothetical protein